MFGLDPFIIAFVGILGLALLLAGQTNLFRSKADQQLKEVERAGFSPKPFMNKSELKLFRILEAWLAQNARDHHISAQATYGAFLGCADYSKWRLMSAKRADFVIFDRTGNVQLIVEFDGGGHFGSTRQDAANIKSRDDQKNAAAAAAGIPLLRITSLDDRAAITAAVGQVIGPANHHNSPLSDQRSKETTTQ